MRIAGALLLILLASSGAYAVDLRGEAIQGGLMFGTTDPATRVTLDDKPIEVSVEGHFVIGFDRDETGKRVLKLVNNGKVDLKELEIAPREYAIERVDGLPPRTVTPDPAAAERIRQEIQMVVTARSRRDNRSDYAHGFDWPAHGRLSGFYGSQRVLNGNPGRPHYGLDVAAPTGTLVLAPADGVITLTHPDMYFSGGTIILDHGQGLSSTFMHLSAILVEAGTSVHQGDPIGKIGATGRASGPHLDWRMNWLDRRVDPQRLVAPMQTGRP